MERDGCGNDRSRPVGLYEMDIVCERTNGDTLFSALDGVTQEGKDSAASMSKNSPSVSLTLL